MAMIYNSKEYITIIKSNNDIIFLFIEKIIK